MARERQKVQVQTDPRPVPPELIGPIETLNEKSVVIRVTGNAGIHNGANSLKERLVDCFKISDLELIYLDMSNIEQIDSTILGIMLGCIYRLRKIKPTCSLILVDGNNEALLQTMKITRFDQCITMIHELPDATEELAH